MTNQQLLRAGVIASTVLLLGGGFAIYKLTEYEPTQRSADGRPLESGRAEAEARPRLVAPAEAPAQPAAGSEAAPQKRAVPTALYSAARVARGASDQVAAVERREALRNARAELIEGFKLLRKKMEKCRAQDASFILTLEALDGEVRVEEARVEEQGSAPSAAVACVRSELQGQVIAAPSLTPGRRWEVSF